MKSLGFLVALLLAGYLGLHFTPAGRRALARMEQSEQRAAVAKQTAPKATTENTEAPTTETERFIESWESPMLLAFWQPHCGSCEQMEPKISDMQRRYPAFRVLRINTREPENRNLCDRYQLRGTPTFVVTLRGRELRRKEGGYATVEELVAFVQPSKVF